MKTLLMSAAAVLATTLGGCVVAPLEPVHVAPPPPAAVVVRPAYRHHYHGHRPYSRRGWR